MPRHARADSLRFVGQLVAAAREVGYLLTIEQVAGLSEAQRQELAGWLNGEQPFIPDFLGELVTPESIDFDVLVELVTSQFRRTREAVRVDLSALPLLRDEQLGRWFLDHGLEMLLINRPEGYCLAKVRGEPLKRKAKRDTK